MKSYFLENIVKLEIVEKSLNELLPGQSNPWLIQIDNDAIAYIVLMESEEKPNETIVQIDISGRHYEKDKEVLKFLKALRLKVGGDITNDI